MGASPPCPAQDATQNVEPLEVSPDANDQVVSWQTGMDAIDAFFASCRTTPRTSADRGDHDNVAATKDGGQEDLLTSNEGLVDSKKNSFALMEPPLTMPHREHQDSSLQMQTEPQCSTIGPLQSSQRTLLNSDNPGAFTPKSPARDLADVVASKSTLHVKPATNSTARSLSVDDVDSQSQPLPGNMTESPGSPMDLDTPPSSPRPPPINTATPPQPAAAVLGCEVEQRSAGKTSLFDEMRSEDCDATTARCTSETDPATDPPVGCSMTRKLSGSADLPSGQSDLDLAASMASPEGILALPVTARKTCKRAAAAADGAEHESMAVKHARPHSPDDAEAASSAPSTATATDMVMAMEGVEATDAAAAPPPPPPSPPTNPSAPPQPHAPAAAAHEQPISAAATSDPPDPHPLPATQKPRLSRKSTSTLINELKALHRSPAGGPADVALAAAVAAEKKKPTRTLTPASSSSPSSAKAKANAKVKKARPLSPRRTRAQQRVTPTAPSGAAAAKRRHRKQG